MSLKNSPHPFRARRSNLRRRQTWIITLVVSLSLWSELSAEIFYWDADPGAGTGGTGTWDNVSSLWRPGSPTVSPTFWPVTGGDNDAYLRGATGTLTLGSSIRVNDLHVAPTSGFTYFIAGNAHLLSLAGPQVSQIDVAASANLAIRSQLHGTSGLIKTGLGKLIIDNFANNLTGPVTVTTGTLQIGSTANNSSTAALRSAPVHLASGTTLTLDGTGASVRIGTLTGSGTVNALGNTIYIANFGAASFEAPAATNTYFATGPVFSGSMSSALTIGGAGGTRVELPGGSSFSMMTLNGDLRELRSSIAINSGAGLTITGTGSLARGVTNASRVDLRGGALVIDAMGGNASGGLRIPSSSNLNLASGTFVSIGSTAFPTDLLAGKARIHSGASTISLIQPGTTANTLRLSGLERPGTAPRGTVDFRAEGGVLGSAGSNPRITIGGLSTGLLDPWVTINGSTYATYDTTNGLRAAPLTNLAAQPSGSGNSSVYYNLAGSAELGAGSFSARGVRILPGEDGASLALNGAGDLVTGGILLAGSRDFSITSSGSGGLSHTGPRYIGVAEAGTTLTISAAFKSTGQDIVKYGKGVLELTADHSATLSSGVTSFVINDGALRASLGANGSLPSNGNTAVVLRGGILEIANGSNGVGSDADFRFALGSGGGKVNWSLVSAPSDEGGGGFAAIGNDASVNIGGLDLPATLQWETDYFIQNGQSLHLNSTTADRRITLLNHIALDDGGPTNGYYAREFRIADNPLSSSDSARITGVISGSVNADLLKTGAGTLELTGHNTFAGNTIVQEGVLQAGAAGALSGTAKIIVKSHITTEDGVLIANNRGTLLLHGDPAATDRIADNAQVVLEGGVFGANGRSETVGALTLLHLDSILDMGHLADGLSEQVLRFGASDDLAWSGTLQIWNWSGSYSGGGTDQLYFGSALGGLRADQLAAISFYSDDGHNLLGTGNQLITGEVIPVVPEPSPVFHSLALLLLVGGTHRWRWRKG